jgi:hypothetical protein
MPTAAAIMVGWPYRFARSSISFATTVARS